MVPHPCFLLFVFVARCRYLTCSVPKLLFFFLVLKSGYVNARFHYPAFVVGVTCCGSYITLVLPVEDYDKLRLVSLVGSVSTPYVISCHIPIMGVCLDKDAVIKENLAVQGDRMPTSSTAKLRAAKKQVNLPGKTLKVAGKKLPSARDAQVAPSKRIGDKDSSVLTSTSTKEILPDANIGEDNGSSAPTFNPASVAAVGKGISGTDAEPPLMDLPISIAENTLSESESTIKNAGTALEFPSKEEEVMGNAASSKQKDGKNGSTEKVVNSGGGKKLLNPSLESSPNMVAGNAAVESTTEESVGLTGVVASFKMPNIPDLTKPAPDFCGQAVADGQFTEIKLSDYKGKYLVLFFYPLDFTFVCPTEIISFSDRVEEFRKVNCELIACSTDSQYSHFAWVSTSRKQGGLGALNIPLLADKTGQIAKDYGCFKEDEGIAFRGLYIIDDKGRLRQITINDLPVGRSVDETLRLVQAFQFTDKYGEVCPAGWKPGDKSMKPDPAGSKEYFQDKH